MKWLSTWTWNKLETIVSYNHQKLNEWAKESNSTIIYSVGQSLVPSGKLSLVAGSAGFREEAHTDIIQKYKVSQSKVRVRMFFSIVTIDAFLKALSFCSQSFYSRF